MFSLDGLYDVSVSWNYILLSATYNSGLGKWAKIEGNDGKLLRVKTSLVDLSVYTWATTTRIVWAEFYWYVKSFHLTNTGKSLYYISTQPFSTTCKHHYRVISQGNGKFVACTPCLNCHFHNKLKGLRRVYVGMGPLVCIINLLISPVGNVFMRLGFHSKGTEDFRRQ